ncbi:MAG: hypothetical protein ABIZ70_04295 [Gemmatimonadales bacterium]
MKLSRRVRSLVAMVLFGGGTLVPFADALVFHSGTVRKSEIHIESRDANCHVERCELGAPVAAAPPAEALPSPGRFTPVVYSACSSTTVDTPRDRAPVGVLGARAPPLQG